MKDWSQQYLEEGRPNITALDGVNFCLEQLYLDKTKNVTDEIVRNLTFEELIGVLLVARDQLEAIVGEEEAA